MDALRKSIASCGGSSMRMRPTDRTLPKWQVLGDLPRPHRPELSDLWCASSCRLSCTLRCDRILERSLKEVSSLGVSSAHWARVLQVCPSSTWRPVCLGVVKCVRDAPGDLSTSRCSGHRGSGFHCFSMTNLLRGTTHWSLCGPSVWGMP